ncbi:MAG: hypothetical protein HYW47_03605 [Deltaproteobacteria bacterium]|nr:hypothetical protein [Deltaproteobacteria bacterium]
MLFFRLFLFFLLFLPVQLQAYAHLESTFSGGYYRDSDKDPHWPSYFYWNFNQTNRAGVETSIHMGVNNDVVFETWRFFLYHATVTLPYKTSQMILGRQFFSEGFEVGMLDGVQAHYDWSSQGGIWMAGGGLHNLEKTNMDFNTQLYGFTAHEKFLSALFKLGYFLNVRDKNKDLHFVHSSMMKEWDQWFLKPWVLMKGQFNVEENSLEQASSEFRLHPTQKTIFSFDFLSQKRNHLVPNDGDFLYGILISSSQKTFHTSLTWLPLTTLQIELGGWYMKYDSSKGEESSNRIQLSTSWQINLYDLNFFLGRVHSYGGKVWHGGGGVKKALSEWADFRVEANVAYIEKINSIKTWAYHVRSGLTFKLATKFVLSALLEVERNHRFEVDSRGMIYVSHYLY